KATQENCFRLALIVFLSVCSCAFAEGQQARKNRDPKSLSYAFVSPNTSDSLTLAQAQAGLSSIEEAQLIREVRVVSCKLRQPFMVRKAVGAWSDGAEYSTIIRSRTNEASLRYVGSWLGRFARQKAILYFQVRQNGGGRMFILSLPPRWRDMGAISTQLDTSGLANRTIARRRNQLLVFIVDLKNELGAKVSKAIRRLGAHASTVTGKGEFIGDDDRDKAQQIFAQEITHYEKENPAVAGACRRPL
ncbi:MAG TPA: hypothetical protein VGN86_18495, partial [Pyrinomonadaceae bacterium]|nr:hypothetical protein [Pyrinomonadaceae bacterium]